jgi:cell shape-determining protein MreC
MTTIQQLQNKIDKLEEENELLKKKLFTYTNSETKRKYYESNKELVKAKINQ